MTHFRSLLRHVRAWIEPVWLIRVEVHLARVIVSWFPLKEKRMPTTRVLLTPFPEGSRGDEALLLGSISSADENTIVLSHRPNSRFRMLVPSRMRIWTVPGLLYAIPPFSFISTLVLFLRVRHCGVFTVVGADLLDGVYWVGPSVRRILIPVALTRLGLSSEIVGFSWRNDPHPHCARALLDCAQTVSLRPRDVATLERLRAMGIHGAREGVDLALGIENESQRPNRNFLDWVAAQHRDGRKILVFGPHGQNLRRHVEIDALLDMVHSAPEAWALAVVPMDERFFAFDRTRANFIGERGERMGIPTFVFPRDTSVRQLIASLTMVDAVFTFRLHLAILALRVGVPCIGVDYNDKFRGIFRLFGVEEFLISQGPLVREAANVWATLRGRLVEVSATIRSSGTDIHARVVDVFLPTIGK